jgi:hypothetical protein
VNETVLFTQQKLGANLKKLHKIALTYSMNASHLFMLQQTSWGLWYKITIPPDLFLVDIHFYLNSLHSHPNIKYQPFIGIFSVLTFFKSPIVRDIMPCSPLKVNRRLGGTCRLHLQGWSICQARNQHEAGSKRWLSTLVDFQQNSRCYIPEDRTLHNHSCENVFFFQSNIKL